MLISSRGMLAGGGIGIGFAQTTVEQSTPKATMKIFSGADLVSITYPSFMKTRSV
jgi:hypothetical protein